MYQPQSIFAHVIRWNIVIVEEARLKPGLVATHKGPVRNMSELKKAAQLMYANNNNMFQSIQT